MKLKYLAVLLLCSATLPAFSGNIELKNGTNLVIGTTTVSTNGSALYVGRYDPDNVLTITNGGTVTAAEGFIGKESDNNSALVTGTNSSLRLTESLTIGTGKDNSLVVEESGWVSIGATNGIAGAISIGNTNSTAKLTLKNGGTASAEFLYVGTQTNESGSVTLSDSGTELNISSNAYLGTMGSNNTITISSGASMVVSNRLEVGSATSSNNVLSINSGGKVVIINEAKVINPTDNQIKINSGGQLTYTGDANLDNAADNGFNFANGSTLEIGGALQFAKMDSGVSVILNGSLNTNLVSTWDTGTDEMWVGDNTDNNKLTIKEGATATAGEGTAHIGENSNNNAVNVSGTGSVFTVKGQLITGMKGDRNKLSITDGGSATIANDLRVGFQVGARDNSVTVAGSNSTLSVGGNAIIGEKGGKNSLAITDASMDVGQSLYLGKSSAGNSAIITGSNAILNVGSDLLIGLVDDQNTLDIKSGAQMVIAGNTLIGTNGANNVVKVTGTNSLLDITGYLTLGNTMETNSNTGNTLSAWETGRIAIGGDLNAFNGSLIEIREGSQISVGGNYWQDETSKLNIYMSTNTIGMTNLAVAGNAYFVTNTTITVHDNGTKTNEFEQVAVSSEGLFIVGSTTNSLTTELLNDTNSINFVNHLLDISGVVTNDNILLKTIFLSIAEKSGLEGTSLEPLANEIDDMAQSGNANAIAMRNILGAEDVSDEQRNKAMNDYYGEKASSLAAHNVVNQGIASIASELTVRGDNTRTRMQAASAPSGAAGPHTEDQQLQGWISGYGTWGTKDAAGGFGEYDVDLSGFVIGADLAVSKNILVGLAGGSNSGNIDKKNGASGDTRTTYGAVYASLGITDWFLDGSMIYGSSSIDNTLGSMFDTTSSYDAQNFAFYLGGGKEIIGKYLIITPQASLLANYYDQDAYTEKSTTAVARSVDSFDALYVQSSIGCNLGLYMAMGNMTLKPELRAHWLHEFNADNESQHFGLVGGTGGYNMLLQAPEEDILKLGAGVSSKIGEFLELRADLDTRWGSDYSDYTLLGSLRYQF